MPSLGRRWLRRRAVADHDVAGLKLGRAERLAKLVGPCAQLRRGRGPLRPHPHRGALAAEGDQRMHGAGRLDIERETRLPDPLRGFVVAAATVARDLELRHRGALRGRERDLEIPARHRCIDRVARSISAIGQGGDLQQRLARDRSIRIVEQAMGDAAKRRIRRNRRRGNGLRRRQRAAKWRRRSEARGDPLALRLIGRRDRSVAGRAADSWQRFLQDAQCDGGCDALRPIR